MLSSAGGAVSAEWAPRLVDAGAVVVDNTSYWRMHDDVPLVVAEVNPDALDAHQGIVANPNCSAMQMVVALAPIHRAVGIERIIVSTYQPVSGTGRRAMRRAARPRRTPSSTRPSRGRPRSTRTGSPSTSCRRSRRFKDGDDYTTEERKMMAETRKILGATEEELRISATCVRVPVFVGRVRVGERADPRAALAGGVPRPARPGADGVIVVDSPGDGVYPLASDVAGRDEVLVGRIRRDPSHERCLNMWIVGDNLRKGAATNAVQVAELLHERGLIRRSRRSRRVLAPNALRSPRSRRRP